MCRSRSMSCAVAFGLALCVVVPPVVAVECLEVVGTLPIGAEISAIAVSGDYAYLGTAGFLLIVDVSDPFAPEPVGATWIAAADINPVSYTHLRAHET